MKNIGGPDNIWTASGMEKICENKDDGRELFKRDIGDGFIVV